MKKMIAVSFAIIALVFCAAAPAAAETHTAPLQICLADHTMVEPAPSITSPTNDMQATSNGEAYCIVRCMAGYRCVPDANGGKCVPDPEPQGPKECPPCLALCLEDTHLVVLGNCDCVCVPNSQ